MDRLIIDCSRPDDKPEVVPCTADEVARRDADTAALAALPPPPLDEHGALVPLLAVQGVFTTDDGAKLLKVEPAVLEAEAVAWKLAQPKPAPAKPKG